ncbi:MAG TPA: hypothetical protein VKN14_15550, partial [Flavobacteriaceae bacterium]|nr:hypothetical protein [Flavobacteriaceae bacterium]
MSFKKSIKDNPLIKVASFNSLSVFVRLISGFVISKAFAYFLMPQGMAITGNLRSFLRSCQGISAGATQNGVIKYISEFKDDDIKLKQIISTSFFTIIFFTTLVSLFLLFFANFFSNLVFNTLQYSYVIKVLSCVLPIYAINIFLLSIINGLEKYKNVVIINTIGYIVNVIILL